MLNTTPAFAQLSSAPTDAQELRRNLQREEEEHQRQQNAPDVRLQKEQPVPLSESYDLPAESPCFIIKDIQLEGDRNNQFPWIRPYLSHYTGRCIGREGINSIVKRLSSRFLSQGYITTRLGIPEQELTTGTLRLILIPGVIKTIHFADDAIRGFWQTAFPARAGDLLNLRDLDQGLEQMKRVPYQDADLEIRPGELPGESDVIIAVKRDKPWRGSLSLDDSGSKATGQLQATAGLSLDNLLGINDLFSLSANHDASGRDTDRGTNGYGFFYSFPYGYWTTTFSGSTNKYHQTVAAQAEGFKYRGTSTVLEANTQRLIHRDQVSKTSLQAGVSKRKSKTYLEDVELEVQRRDVTAAEVSLYHRRYFDKTVLDITIAHRQGVPWLHAQPDLTSNATDTAIDPSTIPTTRYKIQTIDISLSSPFQVAGLPIRYSGRIRGQYTKDRIFISEQFSIGNRYTVRGFDGEQSLLAECGWFIRNELDVPLFQSGQQLYLGMDHGEVSGPSSKGLVGRQLTGSVIGLRGGYSAFFYDVFAGWPLFKPKQFHTTEPAAGFQVTVQF